MNEFENYLQTEVKELQSTREQNQDEELNENSLFELVLAKIKLGKLSSILKAYPDANVDPLLENCIYIEARMRGFSPDNALVEMKKQMEMRKLDD